MAIRKLIQQDNPKLKAKNETITDFSSLKLKKLIKDLTDTVKKEKLVGIAAPQIGENFMVFLTYPKKTRYRNFGREDSLRVCINPTFIYKSKKESVIYEGCGSLREDKGYRFGPVSRPAEVAIEANNIRGRRFRLRANGILARVIQHEYDHLRGIEFTNYVKPADLVSEKFYKENIRNSKKQKAASEITKIEYTRL